MRSGAIAWAAGLLLCLPAAGQLTDLGWEEQASVPTDIPEMIITDHLQLRDFAPSGEPADTKEHGLMTVEMREGAYPAAASGINEPASILVRYRNRLIAAATGYRLGSALTENGIVIESWSGADDCSFTRWRLEFAGERLELTESDRFRSPSCRD